MQKNKHYMNPYTGSVALGGEWLQDFKDEKEFTARTHGEQLTFQAWGGDELIEVEKINNEWKEV